MMRGVLTPTESRQPITVRSPSRGGYANSRASRDRPSNLMLFSAALPRVNLRCNCAGGSGDNESKTILDAFFLGKALAEALNERVESAVGEFLSTIGRLQAEQQRQVQDFQEEVLEKARRAKEQAAREAMEAQGLTPKQAAVDKISRVNNVSINVPPSVSGSVTSVEPVFSDSKPTGEEEEENPPTDKL